MNDLQKNNVPAVGQVKKSVFIHENSGIRVLFAGNSITKHSPRPAMGWMNDCGMAASDIDHDYVHLLLSKIRSYDKNAAWAIAQVGGYEANLFNGANPQDHHSEAAEFNADIIIMFYGANTPKEYDTMDDPPRTFGKAYEEMRLFLDKSKNAKVIHCQGFYVRPRLEQEKQAICKKYNDTWVSLGDIGTRADTHGKFNHPSDLGMQIIADAIWEKLEEKIKEILF
ncbi:MAG: SGNH/GDSL hydrolase family protein [Ruminococcaceae bacterium]|nr:SGNH/GDSL hydrolase family protein [Oscillospiraceae bacterium]